MSDYIQEVIEKTEQFYLDCKNCICVDRIVFDQNSGFFCTGIIKYPDRKKSFDVIRFCTWNDEDIDCIDLAPDEAILKSELLNTSVRYWLEHNKKYIKFRKYKD